MSTSTTKAFRRDEVADYERRRYRGLDQRLVHDREMRILERVFRAITPGGGFSVLDAPCGYGRFSPFLLARATFLVSTDYSPAMVERAVTWEANGRRPVGAVSDLKLGLPFAPASFETVFSLRFFHHLHESADRRTVLREFARVSRRWAVISFYELNPLHRFQRWVRGGLTHRRYRIKMLTREEFVTEAREAGWDIVRIHALIRGIHGQHIALLRKRG